MGENGELRCTVTALQPQRGRLYKVTWDDGTEQEVVRAPFTGLIFTMREYPVVTDGSLIARIFGGVVR